MDMSNPFRPSNRQSSVKKGSVSKGLTESCAVPSAALDVADPFKPARRLAHTPRKPAAPSPAPPPGHFAAPHFVAGASLHADTALLRVHRQIPRGHSNPAHRARAREHPTPASAAAASCACLRSGLCPSFDPDLRGGSCSYFDPYLDCPRRSCCPSETHCLFCVPTLSDKYHRVRPGGDSVWTGREDTLLPPPPRADRHPSFLHDSARLRRCRFLARDLSMSHLLSPQALSLPVPPLSPLAGIDSFVHRAHPPR